ncbi:hypothetical protein ZOSMA_38G00160 [Zostera marina]|uniref:Uncharacterized protein n=1 Tax=Zostera marina TaxID=29655 RepID=A0A0K9P4I2_ZOSMR|nr:hypothetical protein ZOSMA_38G00160 [Zostera marina]
MPVVNEMPTSVVKEIPHSIVKEMPTSVVKEIPHYVVNEMPISVVNEMPITAVNKIPHSVMNEIPISVVNEMSSVNLSPNLDDVLEKSSNRISLPHDMDTTSPIGSFSLNSSSSVEAEDCTILMCVKKNPSKEKGKKSVFIRTLRSGKVFYSDGDRMSRRSKFSPGPSTRMTKVVCHKVRDDVTKSKAPMIESEPSEGDKDCPS